MKKWLFLGICLLILATIFFGRPEKSDKKLPQNLHQAMEKEAQMCLEFKENNQLIKRCIFAIFALKSADKKKFEQLGHLIISVQKAEKLIDQSDKELKNGILQDAAREKLIKIKNDLKEADALHRNILNGLSALLSPEPKPVLT